MVLETKNGIDLSKKVKYFYNTIYPYPSDYKDKEDMV